MFERLKHMLIKEFIQALRDPRMRTVIIAVPVIQTLVFGYAVTTDVKHVPTAVYDLDNSVESRELITRFVSSNYFKIVQYVTDGNHVRKLLDRGDAKAVLQINSGFGDALGSGKPAKLQLIVDGTDSNTAGIILNYAARITGRFSDRILTQRITRIRGQASPVADIELETRAWFNENLESRNFYVPGVIALLLMLITLMLSSMAIVREKEIGTIEQIIVTPIRRVEFVLGKTIPFALIGFVDVVLIILVASLWFGVPIRGSLLLLFVSTALYLTSTLGAGLLISTVSSTQQQAMMSTFFVFLPAVLLSGFLFPIANMPLVVQWMTYVNPLRYFLVIIRGIFLKGIGVGVLWPQMAALALLGSILLSLASRRFKKTLA